MPETSPTTQERILPFDQALAEVLTHARALPARASESVPLLEAVGRVLAAPVLADRDQPPFNRSTRDGYALCSSDLGTPLALIGTLRAGDLWTGPELAPGQAIEIMTGAPVPAGADAVLMVEHATLTDGILTPDPARTLRPGENIVPRAAEARTHDVLLATGSVHTAAGTALAATCGTTILQVFTRPTVAIIATGDELVELDATPEPHQIRNSNSYALAALVRETGGTPARLAIARDSFIELTERVQRGMAADLLLLSGGVSMGKYDLVEQVLLELGAEFFFTGALIQPGKPIVFGRLPTFDPARPWTYFFGLPGNPVSTQVCFHLFVAPLLRAMSGRTDITPTFVEATLTTEIPNAKARITRFLPAELTSTYLRTEVHLLAWQGSGDLATNARANSYIVLPTGQETFPTNTTVRVLLR